MDERNRRILVIPDTHCPYQHPDAWSFIAAVKERFGPSRAIHLGDEIDGHALHPSHEHNPDLASPGHELVLARRALGPLFELFPQLDIMESNHGSLVYRRARFFGLPEAAIKSYREILGAPEGWKWHHELALDLPGGTQVLFAHGKSSDNFRWSKSVACHTVNGHFHEQFMIRYWRSQRGLFWAVSSGCLIDIDSLAFAYNKLNIYRPLLGCTMIIDSLPYLIPMDVGHSGRWTGFLP